MSEIISLKKKAYNTALRASHSPSSLTIRLGFFRLAIRTSALGRSEPHARYIPGQDQSCWNHIPSSDSLKRKNFSPADPDSHVSKRPACHLMNDKQQRESRNTTRHRIQSITIERTEWI
ncbi:hypothetical protein Pst134EA_015071 [Puccinia striiformis f. sp. tritici]|uniref:hypothetical protein n=1 Tax=Puccinia striiformis f. sp. tritici TaxID=168172 RepID=UPI00200788EF|nr:hypothetical protein Pst134EA_015071 [Puccinia striiformis f. sp. tritici]KAH9462982.1 hypothetical protein Pst134EA_015071 [Puccinia striiformis f. sp. tritici]